MDIKTQNNINVELFFESYANSFDSIYGHNKKEILLVVLMTNSFVKKCTLGFNKQ